MNLILHLPPEIETKLKEQSRSLGKRPEELALEALDEKLSDQESLPPLAHDAWLKEFRAFLASLPSRDSVTLDDSRESIYQGRGE